MKHRELQVVLALQRERRYLRKRVEEQQAEIAKQRSMVAANARLWEEENKLRLEWLQRYRRLKNTVRNLLADVREEDDY